MTAKKGKKNIDKTKENYKRESSRDSVPKSSDERKLKNHWILEHGQFSEIPKLKVTTEEQKTKIEDLRKQIDLMSDQLGKKDDEITQLSEVTQKQAVHI